MTSFTIEVVVGDENRIVQVESPKGDKYLELVSRFGNDEYITKQDYQCLIDFCTDLSSEDLQQMGPRAMMKTLNACGFVLEEKPIESEEELVPEEFGDWVGGLA